MKNCQFPKECTYWPSIIDTKKRLEFVNFSSYRSLRPMPINGKCKKIACFNYRIPSKINTPSKISLPFIINILTKGLIRFIF